MKIAYFTDLEGSYAKLTRFYARSGAFDLGRDQQYHIKPGWIVVYGGDVPDRFFGSLAVTREFVRLHRESFAQFVQIGGNRDINKIRIPPELMGVPAGQPRIDQLKHILKNTMGAPDAFELVRQELGTNATDADVVERYLYDLGPGGAFTEMLFDSQLAFRHGDTLFLHGGLALQAMGYAPGHDQPILDVNAWIQALNDWYLTELGRWAENQDRWDGVGSQPGDALIRYQMPPPGQRTRPESVVYGRNVDESGMPILPDPVVIQWLRQAGISRLVIGHTPTGDAPVILRTTDFQFEVISADNSWSHNGQEPSIVLFDGSETSIRSEIFLSDRNQWGPLEANFKLGEHSLLGLRTQDGAISIGKFDGDLVGFKAEGPPSYKVTNRILCQDEIRYLASLVPAP